MFKKVLRFVGEGTANTLEGLLQDFFSGKKARRGRNGAWKAPKPRRQPRMRSQRTIIVYGNAYFN